MIRELCTLIFSVGCPPTMIQRRREDCVYVRLRQLDIDLINRFACDGEAGQFQSIGIYNHENEM